MKNIFVLPTNGESRLYKSINGMFYWQTKPVIDLDIRGKNYHIYITNNEDMKYGDWVYHCASNKLFKYDGRGLCVEVEKIILTTDQDLIKDGVQAIDDDFLEWFVKNPSCEIVEVERGYLGMGGFVKSNEPISKDKIEYKIIIPKEESKQEKMYSEQEVKDLIEDWTKMASGLNQNFPLDKFNIWFEQFKKK